MFKNHLGHIKGRLVEYFFETYSAIHTTQDVNGVARTNYEEFAIDFKLVVTEIFKIDTVNDLDRFCDEYGLNEVDPEFSLSFPNLVRHYMAQ